MFSSSCSARVPTPPPLLPAAAMDTGGDFSVTAAPPGIGIRRISGGVAGTGRLVFISSGRVALLAYCGRGFRRRLAGPGLFSVGDVGRRETERLKRDPAWLWMLDKLPAHSSTLHNTCTSSFSLWLPVITRSLSKITAGFKRISYNIL
jgi:hypothetical protein